MNPCSKNLIRLENGMGYLTHQEKIELDEKLKEHGIFLLCYEDNDPKASLHEITIFIGEHITELFCSCIVGAAGAAVYDVLKWMLKKAVFAIKKKITIVSAGGGMHKATPTIQFITSKGSISAIVPSDLSPKKFDSYMRLLKNAVESVTPSPLEKHEEFVIEKCDNSKKLEVLTLTQYAHKQWKKQKGKCNQNRGKVS